MISETKIRGAFKSGWANVRNADMKPLRERIQSDIGFSQPAFYKRMRGEVISNTEDADKIEKAFKDFGYTDIWD